MRNQVKGFAALYGENPHLITPKKKKRKKHINWEEIEQIKLATWLTKLGLPFFHIPNEGQRHIYTASKLRAMGLSAGVPDLMIPLARKSHHGLFLELKREHGGRVSPKQQYWLDLLNKQGYKAEVAEGFDKAREIVVNYMS